MDARLEAAADEIRKQEERHGRLSKQNNELKSSAERSDASRAQRESKLRERVAELESTLAESRAEVKKYQGSFASAAQWMMRTKALLKR